MRQHNPFNYKADVISLEGLSGQITFTSNDGTVIFTIGAGNIDFSAPGGGGGGTVYYAWSAVTIATALVSGHGYVANSSGSAVPFTLPSTASIGDHFKITGYGSAGWTLGQHAGQTIHFSGTDTTTGTGGSLASQNRYDGVELICVKANTDFVVVAANDSLTVV